MAATNLRIAGKVAQTAFAIVSGVAVWEIVVALLSGSVALLADGIHSLTTATTLLIVWVGIHLSGRSPDGTFHFGYFRVEALASLMAAFLMTVFGGLVIFEAYLASLQQRTVSNAELVLTAALLSAVAVGFVSVWVERASQQYSSTSLRVGALNGSIDVLASVGVCASIILSSSFGIAHADTVAGVLIAIAIFSGAYSVFKESSLVLADACKCGDIVNAVADIAREVKGIKEVHSIRLRQLGPYLVGDMHIVVSSDMLVKEADQIATEVEEKIKKEFGNVTDLKIRIESDEAHDRHSREFTLKSKDQIRPNELDKNGRKEK